MLYVLIALIGLVCTFAEALEETAKSNAIHLEIGREPNAAFALFPSIPLMQVIPVGLAWGLNSIPGMAGLGAIFVIALQFLYLLKLSVGYRAAKKKCQLLGR